MTIIILFSIVHLCYGKLKNMPENHLIRLYEHHLNILLNIINHKKKLGLCTKKSIIQYKEYVQWLNKHCIEISHNLETIL